MTQGGCFDLSVDFVVYFVQANTLRKFRLPKIDPPLAQELAERIQEAKFRQAFFEPQKCPHLVNF